MNINVDLLCGFFSQPKLRLNNVMLTPSSVTCSLLSVIHTSNDGFLKMKSVTADLSMCGDEGGS